MEGVVNISLVVNDVVSERAPEVDMVVEDS